MTKNNGFTIVCEKSKGNLDGGCGGEYHSGDLKIYTRRCKSNKRITETLFNCPLCNKEYIVIKENKEIRKMKHFLRAFNTKCKKNGGMTLDEIAILEKKRALIKKKTDELNKPQ